MPNILRLIPPVGYRVIQNYFRLREYSRYPYCYPLPLRYRFTHTFAFSLVKPFRIRFVFHGLKNAGDDRALFVFNHQSDFDPPAIMAMLYRPCGYLAKKVISTFPIINHIVSATDGDYLDRYDIRQEVRTIRGISQKLKNDPEMGYVIFPEGKRSQDPYFRTMSEYKPGSLKAAYNAKADIVPVALYGTYRLLEFGKRDFKVYPVQVTFLPRIKYEDYKGLSTVELSKKIQALTEAEVDRMRHLQAALESYWNQPEQVREFRRDVSKRMKEYFSRRRKEARADRKLARASLKEHPRKDPFIPVTYTKVDKKHDAESKRERAQEKAEFIRRFKEAHRGI